MNRDPPPPSPPSSLLPPSLPPSPFPSSCLTGSVPAYATSPRRGRQGPEAPGAIPSLPPARCSPAGDLER
eukprot:767784-Hanusia_phi.AAC.2